MKRKQDRIAEHARERETCDIEKNRYRESKKEKQSMQEKERRVTEREID
jgi:hypothetical protein